MSNIIKKEVIGKIIPSPKGDWNEKDTYDRMDFVMYDGCGYVCRQKHENKRPDMFKSIWVKVTERGEKGLRGERGDNFLYRPVYKGVWKPNEQYDMFDTVFFRGSGWMCLHAMSLGETPGFVSEKCPAVKLEAENYSNKYGNIHVEKILTGDNLEEDIISGKRLVEARNNDWIVFHDVELGKGMSRLLFRYSSKQKQTTTVEVYLNVMNSHVDPVTSFVLTPTYGIEDDDQDERYDILKININPFYFKGKKNIYFKFINNLAPSNDSNLGSVDYIEFSNDSTEGYPWGMICKGFDYDIDETKNEINFRHGVKTYIHNIYDENEKPIMNNILYDMSNQLSKIKKIFKSMNMWYDEDETEIIDVTNNVIETHVRKQVEKNMMNIYDNGQLSVIKDDEENIIDMSGGIDKDEFETNEILKDIIEKYTRLGYMSSYEKEGKTYSYLTDTGNKYIETYFKITK